MSDFTRIDPPLAGDEKTLLSAFLDYHRATLLLKVAGVSEADLIRQPTVSTMSLLGLVKHIAYVERGWFQDCFAGRPVTYPDNPGDDWKIEPGETAASVIEFFKTEVSIAQEIVAAASLNELAQEDGRSLRWIVMHMLEEYARHNGHADFLREALDGVTGV